MPDVKRGDIFIVNLNPAKGAEKKKTRPCLIIQNDIGNTYSPLTIVAVITSQKDIKKKYPMDIWIDKGCGGLDNPSIIQCDQIRTIDKARLMKKLGCLGPAVMAEVAKALKISLELS
ncbi:MAG: type II toxin-antitoxin system PemK/MazF family toxin [Sedimentisphaerales bacterium]|nr:type II toxin-antitoxin system PemK/MazF family toxin [Sedimentisphaerales bacterium]